MRSFWKVRHLSKPDAEGNREVLWEDEGPNIFHDEGEKFICDVVFSEEDTVPTNYYLGLDRRNKQAPDAGPGLTEGDTLGDLYIEQAGTGYARQPVASDATAAGFTVTQVPVDTGDWQAKTCTVTFTATAGDWTDVETLFLCTVVSGAGGLLIASRPLSAKRSVGNGESLECSMYVRVSEA